MRITTNFVSVTKINKELAVAIYFSSVGDSCVKSSIEPTKQAIRHIKRR